MVHLATVHKGSEPGTPSAATKIADKASSLLKLPNEKDEDATSIYGSHFAQEDLPRHKMREGEMPKSVAYRMIKDELSLDNNPKLK